jgi:glycosyltransferase involved in cell wall biosynthesis
MNKKIQKQTEWPKVSFILLTFNDKKGVIKCINSVWMQDYPSGLIDLVVVDNGSKDGSSEIARKMGARVFVHPEGDLYSNWIRGLHKINGEFVFYLEQDIVLNTPYFIKEMIRPLLKDKRLVATFTREHPNKDMHWVPRYLSYHYSQCDPLYEFLTPKLESTFFEFHDTYMVCKYRLGNIPPVARMFYRVEYLKKTPNWEVKNYFDHDFIITMVKSGYKYWAYVPEPGYFHYHARDLSHLLKKRVRNLDIHYFPYNEETEYKWMDAKKPFEVIRMIYWVVYANLFLPALIRGFLRFLKHRDIALLGEPVIVICTTDVLLWAFINNKVGRKIFVTSLKSIMNIS